ncbi:amidohydrolase 2 [Dichomitus squalens]|uniref:Amidohydrolase 2 n=1 Tax=Dichomitus squalens TaxID=114155 RepID=A0A4Q9N0Y9_9APHY|nr:amidohydrolase 2 [Dichomitus squalens]
MVLSCASPCIQGIQDPANASAMATSVNDQLASQISNNTVRFGAFAALAMHDPAAAAQELNRTVSELGFLGALLNDYQQAGTPDNETFIFYDQPEFDVFWQMAVDLDVPVYLHPRTNPDPVETLLYAHAPFLIGAPQEFAVTLSTHILGLCTNGVFDRFPNLTVIVGHLGERIPSDLFRINDQLTRQVAVGMPMQKNVTFYFQHNILETTSGNFAPDLVRFHAQQIGLDRILYSVDYPYVAMEQGAAFLANDVPAFLNDTEALALMRGRAIEVLKLND